MSTQTKSQTRSNLKFHEGRALMIIAETYPKLSSVISEIIQNAIDAEAFKIEVIADLANNSVRVRDNGEGVTRSQFDKALSEVGVTQKKKGKLGQFGRGLISPFGKCESFEFTSCGKRSGSVYTRWRFTDDLLKKEKNITVPFESLPDLKNHLIDKRNGVWWRSEMKLFGIVSDTAIRKISMASFVADTLNSFGIVMKQRKVEVTVEIIDEKGVSEKKTFTAEEFRGTPIGKYVYEDGGVKTILDVYKANKTGSKFNGSFLVSATGDSFTIPLRSVLNFFSSQGLLDSETIHGLNSGIFEGRIISDIDLNPNRKSFLSNDKFIAFMTHLDAWYQEVGAKYFEESKEDNRMERYNEIGEKSMKMLDHLLAKEDFSDLRDLLGKFEDQKPVIFNQTHPVDKAGDYEPATVNGSGNEKPGTSGSGKSSDKTEGSGIGFKNRKKLVRSNSTGLKFSYDEMPGYTRLWDFDKKFGIVKFNIRHPIWEVCEKRDSALMRLQEEVSLHILSALQVPESHQEIIEEAFLRTINPKVYLMIHAATLSRSRSTKKSGDETMAILASAAGS